MNWVVIGLPNDLLLVQYQAILVITIFMIYQTDPLEQTYLKFDSNVKNFFKENTNDHALKNVICKMSVIFLRPHCYLTCPTGAAQ